MPLMRRVNKTVRETKKRGKRKEEERGQYITGSAFKAPGGVSEGEKSPVSGVKERKKTWWWRRREEVRKQKR